MGKSSDSDEHIPLPHMPPKIKPPKTERDPRSDERRYREELAKKEEYERRYGSGERRK